MLSLSLVLQLADTTDSLDLQNVGFVLIGTGGGGALFAFPCRPDGFLGGGGAGGFLEIDAANTGLALD